MEDTKRTDSNAQPPIFMPTEVATSVGPDGRKTVFFYVPQLELMIKQVIASQPKEYSYRWAYHPGYRIHALFFGWPSGHGAGLIIPEGPGDAILDFMQGTTDVFITIHPVEEKLNGDVPMKVVEEIMLGNTVGLPDVKFKLET